MPRLSRRDVDRTWNPDAGIERRSQSTYPRTGIESRNASRSDLRRPFVAGLCSSATCAGVPRPCSDTLQTIPDPRRAPRRAAKEGCHRDRRNSCRWRSHRRIGPQAVPGRHRNSRRPDCMHRRPVRTASGRTHRAERTRRMPRIHRPAHALRLHAAGQRQGGEPGASGRHHRSRRTVRP